MASSLLNPKEYIRSPDRSDGDSKHPSRLRVWLQWSHKALQSGRIRRGILGAFAVFLLSLYFLTVSRLEGAVLQPWSMA